MNNVKYTFLHLKERIEKHSEGTSMLAIKDILFEYGIESSAIRINNHSYTDFETPFICSIQKKDWGQSAFTIVTGNENEKIEYLDPITKKISSIDILDFMAFDKGIILLMNADGKVDELEYKQNRKKERKQELISNIPFILAILLIMSTLGFMIPSWNSTHWISIIFLITSMIGLFISFLLVWHEVDSKNVIIKEVCGGNGKKMNCDAVLSSSGASFLGISWVIWGTAYFFSMFLTIILFFQEPSHVYTWVILSIISVIYLPFSLYYQYFVIKQWCPLCLVVLCLLIVNAITSIFSINSFLIIDIPDGQVLFHIIAIGLLSMIFIYFAIPILKQANNSKNIAKSWKKLKYDPAIFQALLEKSEKISLSTEGLGITVGNPVAKNEIIKICNPYCGPCAKAHPELENIVRRNNDVKLRIIFTASGEEEDLLTKPVQHFLAIQEISGLETVQQALDDWYQAPVPDYENFAQKYPINGKLTQQKHKIIEMKNWCDKMKIRATPTIFINGSELPENYKITELKNFF